MNLKQKCIVLYANPYRMTDDKTGEVNEGISVSYLTVDNLNPSVDGDAKGLKPCKGSLSLAQASQIIKAPALYDISFVTATNSLGKPELKLKDAIFVSDIIFATK